MCLTLLGTGDARQIPVYNCACVACERARDEPQLAHWRNSVRSAG